MSTNIDESAAEAIRVVFNGPALAGVGATTDAGLIPAKYHVLPWSVTARVPVSISDGIETIKYTYDAKAPDGKLKAKMALRSAIFNVDKVFDFPANIGSMNGVSEDVKETLRRDCIAILFVMMAHGYYDNECREYTAAESIVINKIEIPDGFIETIINTETLNRAATFILARMHTKYQTNHVLGGSPMQASVASAVRAFYGISQGIDKDPTAIATGKAIASMLHWALHPANERLLIPAVIDNSHIDSAMVHAHGPKVTALGREEYFAIRARTPPASTHHFYVAAAAVQHLEPLGILPYMPTTSQMKDIQTGWLLIDAHGAKLHPAARHWGLQRISANQKLVEPVCADLGYAVRKLMPGSSLAGSPILKKEEALSPAWKTFVDAIRAAMDKRGEEMLDPNVMKDIKDSILPTKSENSGIMAVKRLLIQVSKAPPLPEPEVEDDGKEDKKDDGDDKDEPPAPDLGDDGDDDDDDDGDNGGDTGAVTAADESVEIFRPESGPSVAAPVDSSDAGSVPTASGSKKRGKAAKK